MNMKVLQIGKYFYPDSGGIETVTRDISYGLCEIGIRTDVLVFSKCSHIECNFPFEVFRSRGNFEIFGKPISIDYVDQLKNLTNYYDIGLIHLPNPVAMFAALAYWKKPLALLWHSDIVTYPRAGQLLRPAERALIRKADIVIAPTPFHAKGSYLYEEMKGKVVIGPYPFDGDRLRHSTSSGGIPQSVRDFLNGRRLVLAVGRLVPYKGYDILIEAALATHQDIAICVVGTGPLQDSLNATIRDKGLDRKILFVGKADDGDLKELYQMAHIAVMPSVTRAEMYGMTQVEAMSFGIPVVSTALAMSGVPWVNKDGLSGLVVRPGDPAALARALNEIAHDSVLHARLSSGAKETFRSDHDLASASSHYADILKTASTGHVQGNEWRPT